MQTTQTAQADQMQKKKKEGKINNPPYKDYHKSPKKLEPQCSIMDMSRGHLYMCTQGMLVLLLEILL